MESLQDISSIQELTLRLKKEEDKYKKIMENAPFGVCVFNCHYIEYANKTFINTLGYDSFAEVRKKNIKEFLPPEEKEETSYLLQLITDEKITYPYRLKQSVLRKDCMTKQLELCLMDCFIQNHSFTQGVVIDITKEIKQEQDHRKLAIDFLYLSQKSKILYEVEALLNNIVYSKPIYQRKDFKEIFELIDSYKILNKDWELFKDHFGKVYPDFLKRLKQDFPTLTMNDIKHCSCIKLNFGTKETARLFHVKPSSIQIARVRLKKKMNLPESTNLQNFIINY
jgi:PAS domain S-box-containing protein